jgi:hypothetical protein
MLGGDDDTDTGSSDNKTATTAEKKDYIKCSADDLVNALDDNPAKVSKTYKDQYIQVTGTISNIDSDMSYIDIEGTDEYAFVSIQCYIKDSKQEDVILEKSKGDKVTVKGKCTDVGEVLGYSIDIDSIK